MKHVINKGESPAAVPDLRSYEAHAVGGSEVAS